MSFPVLPKGRAIPAAIRSSAAAAEDGTVPRVDAHHHLWRYDPQDYGWIVPGSVLARDYDIIMFDALLAECRVDRSILVQAAQSEAHCHWLCDVAEGSTRVAGVVGWLDLRSPDIGDRLALWSGRRVLVGLRHLVQDEDDPDFLLDRAFLRGVGASLDAGLSYDILVSGEQVPTVPTFLDRLPPGRLILDHGAKPDIAGDRWQPWADAVRTIARHPNVWCKISGMVTQADHAGWREAQIDRYLRHLLDCFGPERLIYGSDWPVCLLAASYGEVHRIATAFVDRHCPGHAAAIFGGNALAAYARDAS